MFASCNNLTLSFPYTPSQHITSARSLLAEAIQQLARKDPIQDRADLCLIRAEIRRIIDPDSPEILAPAENKNNYNSSKLLTHTPKRGGQLDAEVGLQVKPKTRGTRARGVRVCASV
jgi:hypothetical protein